MKINDYILALTSGSLAASQEKISRLFDDFGQRFELKEIAKPGVVSIAGRGDGQKEMNFIDWIMSIRAEGIKDITFYWESNMKASLPLHIAAAFAGGQDYLLQVTTQTSVKTYTLRTILCSQYEIKPAQFADLIDSQNEKVKLWSRAGEMVEEFNKLNDRPAIIIDEVRDYMLGPEVNNVFDMLASQLIKEVQVECKISGQELKIPSHLKQLFYQSDFGYGEAGGTVENFGLDGIEEERAQARIKMGKEEWFIQSNKNPWELYFFERLEEVLPMEEKKSIEQATKEFIKNLQEIASFSSKIKSPFTEAFLLAHYCLGSEIPSGNFDHQHLQAVKAFLGKNGFSERAQQNFENIFYYSEDMKKMNWHADRIYGLFAVSISDVFGGMGSWNDQYIESDQDTYQRLSSELFNALKDYFGVLLSAKLE